jgi:hypothetical protein
MSFVGFASVLVETLKTAVLEGAIAWTCYMALEPYVRRFWPHSIVPWSRLLIGRWRDPWIGRDCVMGELMGVGIVLVFQLNALLPAWFTSSPWMPVVPGEVSGLADWAGPTYLLALTVQALAKAIWISLSLLLIMLTARMVIPVPALANLAILLLSVIAFTLGSEAHFALPWISSTLICIGMAFLLQRFGLVAAVSSLFTANLLTNAPITSNLHAWYISSTVTVLGLLIGFFVIGLSLTASRAWGTKAAARERRPSSRSLPGGEAS